MPVDAVVAGVELPPAEPLPEGGFARIKGSLPALGPIEQFGVRLEEIGEVLKAETFERFLVRKVRLGDEFWRGRYLFLLLPVDRYLCLAHLRCLFSGWHPISLRVWIHKR